MRTKGPGRLTSSGDVKAKAVTASLAARAWSVSEAVAVKDRDRAIGQGAHRPMGLRSTEGWPHARLRRAERDGDTVGLLEVAGPQPWETCDDTNVDASRWSRTSH